MRWEGIVAYIRKTTNAMKTLVKKREGKSRRGRRKVRWEDNINMDHK
jgi:hypothetical protein